MNEALNIIVKGRVQGVGFRFYTYNKAISLHLAGWVKNKWDGSVEIYCEGSKEQTKKLVEWLENGGPLGCQITSIDTVASYPVGNLKTFEIKF